MSYEQHTARKLKTQCPKLKCVYNNQPENPSISPKQIIRLMYHSKIANVAKSLDNQHLHVKRLSSGR